MIEKVRRIAIALITALLVLLPLGWSPVAAMETVDYQYLVASGVLCDIGGCPAVSEAANGDTVEVSGGGTFSIHPKSVTGEGTFIHRNADGDVLAAGTWKVEELLSFHSYGSGAAQGLPEDFEGGLALIRVGLYVGGTKVASAVMQIDCTLGKPPAGSIEGFRLAVHGQGFGINFNEEVSGFTLFIRE